MVRGGEARGGAWWRVVAQGGARGGGAWWCVAVRSNALSCFVCTIKDPISFT